MQPNRSDVAVTVTALCYALAGERGRALLMADSEVLCKVSLLLHRQLSTSCGEPSGVSHTILPPLDSHLCSEMFVSLL